MYSSVEFLKLIAENGFQLLCEKAAPDDVWIVTPEGKQVQMFATGRMHQALRIPKTMLDAFIEGSLVRPLTVASDDNTIYELTPHGMLRGLAEE